MADSCVAAISTFVDLIAPEAWNDAYNQGLENLEESILPIDFILHVLSSGKWV